MLKKSASKRLCKIEFKLLMKGDIIKHIKNGNFINHVLCVTDDFDNLGEKIRNMDYK
jgi:hypothetical protein